MADTKISALTAATTAAAALEFATNDGGTSKRLTVVNLATTYMWKSQILQAGSTTAGSWPTMQTGTLLTVAQTGTFEFDGVVFYQTAVSTTRQVVNTEQFYIASTTAAMANTTSLQKLFAALTTGAVQVAANTCYFFRTSFSLSGLSATSGNAAFSLLGAGTATFTSIAFSAYGMDASIITTAGAIGGLFSALASTNGNVVTAATGTAVFALIDGVVRINGSGTVIPSIALTTATSTVVLGANSYMRIWAIGTGNVTAVGQWS